MRNLKKILALVLALIMSLSLMATAGASSFPDVDDENPYATAIEVLDKLKVFQGYKEDGTFRPTETLNRAQAAVLVYRIATGDVEDKYLENYTFMQQSKFEDLDGYNWAKGYINYCQNAEIVVGTSATTFEPGAKVTGYQLLVMLLRTLGYGKAGEFSDPKGWELQTAAIAEREGILKNVTQGDLGAAAPRQMVAEILFRGLLTEKVAYSLMAANSYTKTGKTLGQEQFGLEQVEGVVMANQWADLEKDSVMKADTTRMKITKAPTVGATVEEGKSYTLDIATDLDAVGLNHTAYIAGKSGNKQVLTIEATGNTVAYNEGKAVGTGNSDQYKATIAKLAEVEDLDLTDKTEWFVDYSAQWNVSAKSDTVIRYSVKMDTIKNTAWLKWLSLSNVGNDEDIAPDKTVTESADKTVRTRYIRPGEEITVTDQAIMEEIFYSADKKGDGWIQGEVYAHTQSNIDQSDLKSWIAFKEDFFVDDINARKFDKVQNGESLRIIDNNGDGKADYVLKIEYTQAKAVDTINGSLLLSSGVNLGKYTDNNLDSHDELALGDIVNHCLIDGKLSIWKAPVITDTIKTNNFQNWTVTTAGGEEKGQSGIYNRTGLDQIIRSMRDKPEYNMYLDQYGYIRSYELAQATKYALLTEMYSGTAQNWNFINSTRWIVEMKAGDEDQVERAVSNNNGSVFASQYAWTTRPIVYNNAPNSTAPNNLQPATAHLGNKEAGVTGTATSTQLYRDTIWARNVFQVGTADMFNYGAVPYTVNANGVAASGTAADSFSYTNVAGYVLDGENSVYLDTASKLHTNPAGAQMYRSTAVLAGQAIGKVMTQADWEKAYISEQAAKNVTVSGADATTWFNARVTAKELYKVYAVDYVQLADQGYKAGDRHYTIDKDYAAKYNTLSNGYVDATVNTEFYVVTPNTVHHFVGYDKLLTIAADQIRASYAVAKNTGKDADGMDYWVADVVVIEVNTLTYDFDSISLMYYNPLENSGAVRSVDSLNNTWRTLQPDYDGLAKMSVVPKNTNNGAPVTWGDTPWTGSSYGFYRLYGTALESAGLLDAADAQIVTKDYNKYGIYAGTVDRITGLLNSSGYIDVDLGDSKDFYVDVRSSTYNTPVYRIYNYLGVTSATTINLVDDTTLPVADVQIGDRVIVVYKETEIGKQAVYLVDLKQTDGMTKANQTIPTWLDNEWTRIMAEQKAGTTTPDLAANWIITFNITGLPDDLKSQVKAPSILVPKTTGVSAVLDVSEVFDFKTFTGYTLGALSAQSAVAPNVLPDGVAYTGASTLLTNDGVFTGVTGNFTINVPYTANAQTVTNDSSEAGITVTAKDSAGSAVITTPATLNTKTGEKVELTIDTAGKSMNGKYVKVIVDTISATVPLDVKHTGGTIYTASFTVPAAAASTDNNVTVTLADVTYGVSVTGDAGVASFAATTGITGDAWTASTTGSATATASATGTTVWATGTDVGITMTPKAGCQIKASDPVTVTVDGKAVPATANDGTVNWVVSGNKVTIKNGAACANKAIAVTFATQETKFTCGFDINATGNVAVAVSGAGTLTGHEAGIMDTTTIIDMTKSTVVTITFTGAACPTVTAKQTASPNAVIATATPVKSTLGNGTTAWTFTLTGITEAATITIA